MFEYLRLLLFPLLVIVGWTFAERNFDLARRICLLLGLIMVSHMLVLAASGWSDTTSWHAVAADSLMIASWLSAPLAIGAALGGYFRRRPWLAVFLSMLALAALGAALLESFTGYLGPSREADEATLNRFKLLHTGVLPAFHLLVLLLWCGLFAPPRQEAEM